MTDELRPITGYEGLYSVTSDGRVWSHPKKNGHAMRRGRWLSPGMSTCKYLTVVLHNGNSRKTATVHRLVAEAWLINPDRATCTDVNHLDGNKRNNAASNLEWCTRAQNSSHAHSTGLIKRGACPWRILSKEQAAEARRLVAEGQRQTDVAKKFGVSKNIICSIVHNRAYRA